MTIRDERGITLIETMIAMGILATGLLSLAAVFALGLDHMQSSSAALLAREKAREAVESVHTARDTRVITWAQIRNVAGGGVFSDGPQPLRTAGADGLVNTADDGAVETTLLVGADGVLGTADDVRSALTTYTRQIQILDLPNATGNGINPNLRELRVTITFQVGSTTRRYVLTTYISAIS